MQVKLKSVSSLFSRKPRSGTVMPDPPVCSMVSVYATALPHWSTTERCVVEMLSVSAAAPPRRPPRSRPRRAAPGATGSTEATSGSITQARASAKSWLSRVCVGTSTNAGSPT